MAGRQRDGARRAVGQRRRTVGGAETIGPRIAEVAAVERLGRLPREVAMLAEAFEARAIDLARCGERAVLVEAQAGAPGAPIVDRPVARPGVEGEQRAVRADPRHVGDAADIHHRERPRQVAHEGCMIDRHQRRALPARQNIGAAQVVHHPHAERLGQRRAVADLPGEVLFRPMRDGLAVEAHDIERRSATPLVARPASHRVEMRLGHRLLGGGRCPVRLLGAEGRADQAAHIVGIGNGEDGAERGEPLAVGLDQRHIDAVDRGPAHQAEGTQKGRGHSRIR